MSARLLRTGIREISLSKLELWREGNVRRVNVFEQIEDLAKNILENGLIVPLIVAPKTGTDKFLVISGQRRLEACRLVNYDPIECVVLPEDVGLDKAKVLSLSENLYRLDMNPNDISSAIDFLYRQYKDIREVAKRLGISDSTVRSYLKYESLPEEIKEIVDRKRINKAQAIRIYTQFPDKKRQIEVAEELASIRDKAEKRGFYRAIKRAKPFDDVPTLRKAAKRLTRAKEYTILVPPATSEAIEKTAKSMAMRADEVIAEILETYVESRLRRGLPLLE